MRLHLRDDQGSLEGVLVSSGRHYVLVGAQYMAPAGGDSDLSGTVYVPRDKVLFFQRLQAL